MSDLSSMLERQAAWQRSRAHMSWTDKLRFAVELRKAVVSLRNSARGEAGRLTDGRTTYGTRDSTAGPADG